MFQLVVNDGWGKQSMYKAEKYTVNESHQGQHF